MHSIMRKQRVFRLIGEPVTAEFLESVFSGVDGKFLSVDYMSATDLLNPRLSLAAVDEICKITGIPSDLSVMFRDALCGHTVEGSPQKWGQLMGSIVSFPILCLVNAAICRFSYELGEQLPWGVSLQDCPLLVNGDDGLLRCGPTTKKYWADLAALGGLTPSVGKVYFHDTYLNINSTSFTVNESGKCVLHPYVNMGLVMGMTRSEGKMQANNVTENQDSFGTIGSRHHELMKGCPDEVRLSVHKMFIRENFELLSSIKVPWYVPESMGGVGLMPFTVTSGEDIDDFKISYLEIDKVRYGPSDLDLKCCRIISNKYANVSVRKLPTSQPVQARQVWYTKKGFDIPSLHVVGAVSSNLTACADSQSDVFSFMDLSTFYFCPSLVMSVQQQKLNALRQNERAWESLTKAALKMSGLPGFDYLRTQRVYKPAFFTM